MPDVRLRRLAPGLALAAAMALWLLALPALLARDGLSRQDGVCPSWRDPVTGRTQPLRQRGHGMTCHVDASGARR